MLQPKSSWRPFWMWPATFAAVVFVLWVLVAIPALGQNRNAGEIRGTVVDATGAAVPGVSVVVTNVATGIATTAATLDAGVYDIPRVDTGRYTVTFTKEGFKRVVRNDVEVHVEAITVDATLEVGSVATQVTVTAKNELLQTENSERTVVLSPTQITELPNVGHNWWSYTLLIPGANPGKGSPGSFSNGNNVGINGSQSNMSSWLIDGGTFTYPGSYNGATQMPLEAIGEINITASDAGAEYGNGMSIMQVITKGGTNSFHGSAFEFVQNDVFNARNFFAPKTSPERWNEFGGTIGGPIKKDKAFFFFGYQRNPIVAHSPTFYTFPTDAMRAGDFSAAGFPTIYDPSTTVLVNGQYVRQPFPGNSIPQSSFDSVAAATLQYYPKPNLPGLFNNYYADLPSPDTSTWYNFRVDGNISDKHRIMVSGLINKEFIFQNTPNCPVNCLDIWGGPNLTGQITETYSISSTLVNEFRLADNHGRVHNWGPDYKAGFPQKLGLKNAVVDAFPNINIGGVVSPSGLGTAPSNALYQNNFVAADTLNWIKGKHAIKLGGEFDKWNVNQAPFLFVQSGTFTFSGIFTRNPSDPSSVGLGYADFLLGLPQTWSVQTGPLTGGRVHNVQLFAQDSYKVRPNLTLNYGIRYLYQAGWTEEHNHIAQFDPTILNPVTNTLGAVWFGGANGRTAVQKSHPAVFLPRVGLSWSPKTSWTVRGAYGIYPMPWSDQNYFGSGQGETGWFIQGFKTSTDLINPIFQLSQGPPTPVYPPADPVTASPALLNGQNLLYNPYHVPMTYMHQWHVGIQHQMGGYLVDASYVGSRIVDLGFGADINQVPEDKLGPGDAQGRRPYPQFAGISGVVFNGYSNYNALQISVRKPFSNGLSVLFNYTYSHSLDTGTGEGGNGMLRTDIWQRAFNPKANYGSSSTDISHNFNGAIVYEVPVGKDRRYLNKGGVANSVVGGWQASTILLVHSGLPFTPVMGTANLSGSLAGPWFPNRLADGSRSSPTVQEWFDPSAFAQPVPFTFGNSGRNILYGPSFAEVNFSLAKSFAIPIRGEQTRLQIRADAMDLFNHPNFGQPNTAIGTTGAGIVSSALTSRVIQLGAVLRF